MKKILNYLLAREDAIFKLLKTPREFYTETTFHKLRVEIKKLAAFFDLLEYCSPNFNQKKQ